MNEIEIKAIIDKISSQRDAATNEAVLLCARVALLEHQLAIKTAEAEKLKLDQKKPKTLRKKKR